MPNPLRLFINISDDLELNEAEIGVGIMVEPQHYTLGARTGRFQVAGPAPVLIIVCVCVCVWFADPSSLFRSCS